MGKSKAIYAQKTARTSSPVVEAPAPRLGALSPKAIPKSFEVPDVGGKPVLPCVAEQNSLSSLQVHNSAVKENITPVLPSVAEHDSAVKSSEAPDLGGQPVLPSVAEHDSAVKSYEAPDLGGQPVQPS